MPNHPNAAPADWGEHTGMGYPPPLGYSSPLPPKDDHPSYAAVFPYRGTEPHGVDADQPFVPHDADEKTWEGVEPPDPMHHEPEPVPVRVVTEASDEIKAFRVHQLPVAGTAVGLVGRDMTRTEIRVKNAGTNPMWVGTSPNVSASSGWPVAAGGDLTLPVHESVYVIADAVNTTTVAVLIIHPR